MSEYSTTLSPPPSQNISAAVYVVVCYLSVLALVGTAGNALVLFVFSKKKDKLTSTVFIIALAAVDFITCLVVMPFTVFMEIVDFHVSSDVCCKVYQFLITCNIPFSALVMVAIAVDRYLCICHPFTGILTLHRAKILVGLLAVVAATLGACVAMFFGVYERPEEDAAAVNGTYSSKEVEQITPSLNGYTQTISTIVTHTENGDGLINTGKCAANDLILGHGFQWYYQKLYTFMYPLCLLVVVVLYMLIYRSVLRRRYKRQQEKRKTMALVRSAQKTDDRQRQREELAVDIKGSADGVSAIENSTLTTEISGCITLLPVSFTSPQTHDSDRTRGGLRLAWS